MHNKNKRAGKKHHHANKNKHTPVHHKADVIEGVLQHHGSFGFLLSEVEGGPDVFLRGRSLELAMDGDRVLVRLHKETGGRKTGEIIEVIKRAHSTIVGILKQHPKGWSVISEKWNGPSAKVLCFAPGIEPQDGMFAVLEVTRWPDETQNAAGTVIEILGDPCNMHVRINSLLRLKGIYDVFPSSVLAESSAFPDKLEPCDWQGREELFHLPVVTIDGPDAKDFDDAVSIENIGKGLVRLGVHIADVSTYVKPHTPLDKEAYSRATSVYLPGRVIPMLPPSLSNNLCSLVPQQERLTLSIFIDIDSHGKVTARRLAKTVICSSRRFTYEEVETLLDGGMVHSVPDEVHKAVIEMGKLFVLLHKNRVKRGALDFDLPEYKIVTDDNGNPKCVEPRPRLKSHRLIEEFMLLANESVAAELINAKAPFLHRRHDQIDAVKIKMLAKTLGDLGLSAGHLIGGAPHKALQDVLRQAQTHPLGNIINSLVVRSMKQAVYSPKSEGHFGIATKTYTHFTSPIRRYPDLMVHRAIYALLEGKKEGHTDVSLAEAGVHCSERERSAAEAEYKAIDIMRAELFKDLVGTIMDGMVTSVIESGTFVSCGDTGAEGMLRVTNLKPGAKVKVKIESVNTKEGKIDLSLADAPKHIPTHWKVKHTRPGKTHKHKSSKRK